jgi:hypothetical protein
VDVFGLWQRLVDDYAEFTRSFVVIRDEQISARVDEELAAGLLWPNPIVQLNHAFEAGGTIDELVAEGVLHERCRQIFRRDKDDETPEGQPLRLHRHQREAIEAAQRGGNYVLRLAVPDRAGHLTVCAGPTSVATTCSVTRPRAESSRTGHEGAQRRNRSQADCGVGGQRR